MKRLLMIRQSKRALVFSDELGVVSSILCMVHCLFTPFIFILQRGQLDMTIGNSHWWIAFDYLFLIVSFFAVLQSAKNASLTWMPIALYVFWTMLAIGILTHSLPDNLVSEFCKWIGAISLIILHLINLRYCKCRGRNCSTVDYHRRSTC